MPKVGITEYDFLISCPGDVNGFIDIIKDCIDNFNRIFGDVNKVKIIAKHWSTDSYPQSGGKPQELLNQQFVRECDAAVALFWTKFGTPTDNYGSGTEEEIEEMLASDKQVFMYFLDKPIDPSCIDMDQYKKVGEFKEKYKDRGIYSIVKDEHELRQQFINHLALHFLPIIMSDRGEEILFEKKVAPILKVRDINSDDESIGILQYTAFSQSRFIEDKAQSIIDDIVSLQEVYLSERDKDDTQGEGYKDGSIIGENSYMKAWAKNNLMQGEIVDADIPSDWKDVIVEFATKRGLELEPQFWNVGNLKRAAVVMVSLWGNSPGPMGTAQEIERYNAMQNLYNKIIEYNEYLEFFSSIDRYGQIELAVANVGNTYDEDVEVKIFIEKKCICQENEIAVPGINIIENILDMDFAKIAFQSERSDIINQFSGYPSQGLTYEPVDMPEVFNGISAQTKYNRQKDKYTDKLESLFCYEYYEKEEQDILKFHISYLKHNTTMAFPSVLIFKDIPDVVNYEISSKHLPNIIKGTIQINM